MGLKRTSSEDVAFYPIVGSAILLAAVILFALLVPVFPCPDHERQDGTPSFCRYCEETRRSTFLKQWQCRRDMARWEEMVRALVVESQQTAREAGAPPRPRQ
jgi:hypothetical protein